MKYGLILIISIGLFLLCACTMFEAKQPSSPADASHKALAVPMGKNWQLIEEAPTLTDGRLPFQTEQSVQPAGRKPGSPAEKLDVETPR